MLAASAGHLRRRSLLLDTLKSTASVADGRNIRNLAGGSLSDALDILQRVVVAVARSGELSVHGVELAVDGGTGLSQKSGISLELSVSVQLESGGDGRRLQSITGVDTGSVRAHDVVDDSADHGIVDNGTLIELSTDGTSTSLQSLHTVLVLAGLAGKSGDLLGGSQRQTLKSLVVGSEDTASTGHAASRRALGSIGREDITSTSTLEVLVEHQIEHVARELVVALGLLNRSLVGIPHKLLVGALTGGVDVETADEVLQSTLRQDEPDSILGLCSELVGHLGESGVHLLGSRSTLGNLGLSLGKRSRVGDSEHGADGGRHESSSLSLRSSDSAGILAYTLGQKFAHLGGLESTGGSNLSLSITDRSGLLGTNSTSALNDGIGGLLSTGGLHDGLDGSNTLLKVDARRHSLGLVAPAPAGLQSVLQNGTSGGLSGSKSGSGSLVVLGLRDELHSTLDVLHDLRTQSLDSLSLTGLGAKLGSGLTVVEPSLGTGARERVDDVSLRGDYESWDVTHEHPSDHLAGSILVRGLQIVLGGDSGQLQKLKRGESAAHTSSFSELFRH